MWQNFKYRIALALVVTSCAVNNYATEPKETANLVLPPAEMPADVISQPTGLDDYIVLSEEDISLLFDNPNYIAERGRIIGAQKALLLNKESFDDKKTVKRYCWGCLLLDVALVTASAYASGGINQLPSFDYGYEEEVNVKAYAYHVVYLIHPDSIQLPDKIKAVEFYDKNDEQLVSTAYFDWNEQLEHIDGPIQLPLSWLSTQPLGFMLQHDGSWLTDYNESSDVLIRYNRKNGYTYRIKPENINGYLVDVSTNKKSLKLVTMYYGQHDWVVANHGKKATLQVDYYLDETGRMQYMKVEDRWNSTPIIYYVRIYYRDSEEVFPENWRWRRYQPNGL